MPKHRRQLTHRPNQKIPFVPVGERKITKIPQLPAHLLRVLDRYPSHVDTDTACEIKGCSRSKLHADAVDGRVIAVKDGTQVKWDVASLVFDLANLPVASFSLVSASRPAAPHEADTAATQAPKFNTTHNGRRDLGREIARGMKHDTAPPATVADSSTQPTVDSPAKGAFRTPPCGSPSPAEPSPPLRHTEQHITADTVA